MNRPALIAPLGFFLGVVSLSSGAAPAIHVPLGGARGPLMMSGLGPSEAVWALPDQEVADARRDFYFRRIESNQSRISIPLRARGRFEVGLRLDTTVRTRIDLQGDGRAPGESFATSGRWTETPIAGSLGPGKLEFTLGFEAAPLVRRSDPESFRRYVDEIVFRCGDGFDLPWGSRIAGGLLVALLVLLFRSATLRGWPVAMAFIGPGILFGLFTLEPVGLSLALPRLLGSVMAGIALIALLGRALGLTRPATAGVVLLGSAMILACGFLSFLPRHSPADLDIHIWRTVDLADVPMSYAAWLRYGSHYPTPSQIRGSATEALGAGPAIPYSPLPYLLFYAAHRAGLDLHWSMNAIESIALALLLPLVFAFARCASSDCGGFLAAALFALDLPTIHHLGRAHAPAVAGGALGLAGLLAFGLALPRMGEPGNWRLPGLFLGLGALGYSSTPLFYALFGIALLALLALREGERSLLGPAAVALGAGAAIALLLYYGHYLPGLIGGRSSRLISDPFPGRTFFIFHNESRQSLRLWRLGLFVPLLAAVPAAFFVVRRASSIVGSFLLAWVSAWGGIMLLKEPWGLPVLLRWAKEDFYVAPSLALLVAIALAGIESRRLRIVLMTASLLASLFLRARDYGFHADTLGFLRG